MARTHLVVGLGIARHGTLLILVPLVRVTRVATLPRVNQHELTDEIVFRSGARMKNRVALAAMTNPQSHQDGTLGDDELRWLELRAAGGFGMVTTCASHVAREGQGFPKELGIWSDDHLPGLARLAKAIDSHGALALVQIFHAGMRAPQELIGERPWSASAADDGPRAATDEDLHRVIAQFVRAAERAREAGFGGVEIHGAHGYLLTQFLSTVENRRTDSWGGSLDNRARLIREVTRKVRAAIPKPFVVGARLSPEDFGNAKGMDVDESVQVAKWLVEDGVDFIHLSLWNAHANTKKRPAEHAATLFRAALPADVPVFVAGTIWTREDGKKMLSLGADAIALGRSAICNPDWPRHLDDPAWQPKRPPLSLAELAERGVSAPFAEYLRRWKGFVEG